MTVDLLAVARNEYDKDQKNVAFKNNASLRSCISKINSTLINNAEDLNIFIPIYDPLEYSQNYSMTSRSLWNYYRDEIDDVDDNVSDGKSFKYKTKIVEKILEQTPQHPDGTQPPRPQQPPVPTLNVEVTIALKYLGNFWRFLDLPLINCEIELNLSCTKDWVKLFEDKKGKTVLNVFSEIINESNHKPNKLWVN